MADGKRGRAAFVPSPEQVETARRMIDKGAALAAIAEAVGCSVPTARRVFADLKPAPAASLFEVAGDPVPAPVTRPTPRAGGRPKYKAGFEDRMRVELLVAVGTEIATIARVIGVSEPTLRRAFADELAHGAARRRADILMAMNRAAKAGNVSAQAKLLEAIEQARLDAISDTLRSGEQSTAAQPIGKKIQQARDAEDVMQNSPWADILPRPAVAVQ
jgi:AraC-like DNA-binding protein